MSNYFASLAHSPEGIDPGLDFTGDTAYVGVKIAAANCNQVAVITSERRIIPWNEADLWESGISATANPPALLDPRWTYQSIRDFLSGAAALDTAAIQRQVRAYLQKYLGLRHPAEYDLIACWIMGAYLKPLFKCYPILSFTAPHESGKSRCLEAISQLALNGKWLGEITPAAFRRCAESKLTFCLDELIDVGLKNDGPLITILLNAYNGTEVALAEPVRGGGWQSVIFKVTNPVAIGNIQEIKNEALKSRTIQIRTEYDPDYKNTTLPGVYDTEPAQIRDGLYHWLLSEWQLVRESYQNYPAVPELSARELDSFRPLLAMAALVGPETVQAITDYAVAAREERNLAKKALDDRWDLLQFLQVELEACCPEEAFPVIANRELADAYAQKNNLRVNYRRFIGMVTGLHVVSDIKDRQGSKYLVLKRSEIDRQLKLLTSKT